MHFSRPRRLAAVLLGCLGVLAAAPPALATLSSAKSLLGGSGVRVVAGVPAAPTNLRQTGATQTSVTVAWDASTGDVAGYDTYRDGAWLGYQHPTWKTVGGLACGLSYTISVEAYNEGRTRRSALVSLRALTSPCSAPAPAPAPASGPAAPTNVRQTAATATSFTVAWDASTGDVAGYDTYRDGDWLGYQHPTWKTVDGLACGSSYTFGVEAYNNGRTIRSPLVTRVASTAPCGGSGSPTPSPAPSPDVEPPAAPGGLRVTGTTTSSLSIAWNASSDNVATTGYEVFRDGVRVGSTAGTGSTVSGLSCGTSQLLEVTAFDAAGNRSGPSALRASTSSCPTSKRDKRAPSMPGGFRSAGATPSSVSVAWNASSDNVAVAGYGLYRNGARVASVGAPTRAFTFGSLPCGTAYVLAVDAFDAAGNRSVKAYLDADSDGCAPSEPAPPPASAARVFVAPGGSDANPCTQAAPCRSFDRAYRLAQAGDTVEVAAGTYPDQAVSSDASKTSSADVFFRPAAGAAVVVGSKPLSQQLKGGTGLGVYGGKHVTFRDMSIRGDVVASGGAEDVTFENLVSANGIFGVYAPTRDVAFLGGSYGNVNRYKAEVFPSGNGTHNYNFRLDGAVLHDIRSDNLSAYHVECILVSDAIGAVVRNTKMYNCDVFDLSLGVFSDGVLSNVLVENNFFASTGPTAYSGLGLNTNTTRWTGLNVRNNTSLTAMRHPICSGGCTNVRYSGNISPLQGSWACVAGVEYRYNVWTGGSGGKCSATDAAVSSVAFVSAWSSPPDLHLASGSFAIRRGDPANLPATDIDGDPRPFGGAPDAGADERYG